MLLVALPSRRLAAMNASIRTRRYVIEGLVAEERLHMDLQARAIFAEGRGWNRCPGAGAVLDRRHEGGYVRVIDRRTRFLGPQPAVYIPPPTVTPSGERCAIFGEGAASS